MASPLDGEQEKHDGPEPRVLTKDVQEILQRVIRPGDEDNGEAVSLIAEKAHISTRTVYRVLQRSTETISLDLGDRLCLAAGQHVASCTLVWPDGRESSYF